VPFGWNSWGSFQAKISYTAAMAVSDFFSQKLQPGGFHTESGIVYVNLDSYWDNLTPTQLTALTAHCHSQNQKAGIYWTPFTDWAINASRPVEGASGGVTYGQTWIRDSSGNCIVVDGGCSMDSSHPATLQRIDYYIGEFVTWGFDYVKLDFLSHGSFESATRYDATLAPTGISAFNLGMAKVRDSINGRLFMSESIAPLFPHQYAHSRRISCDTFGSASGAYGSAEYELNAVTYGWWTSGRTFTYNDPDQLTFSGYTAGDNIVRLMSGVITGTLLLNGDDLTNSTTEALVTPLLTNARINEVIRMGKTFRPVEGNTGNSATDVFVLVSDAQSTAWLAIFNYGQTAVVKEVDLARAGLKAQTWYQATDLWSGLLTKVNGALTVQLNGPEAKLFQLQPLQQEAASW